VVGGGAGEKLRDKMLDAVERSPGQVCQPCVGYASAVKSVLDAARRQQPGVRLGTHHALFFVLAARYKSGPDPFAVLLGVPFGTLGALRGVWLRGMANDVYVRSD